MKILMIFIDMVRVDHLNIFNPDAKECLIDKRLRNLGGTLYTRCFSPSPDTPRSTACMQTGLYPFFNGCDTRIRWPKFFIKDEISTIWDHATNKGMRVNLCVNKNLDITGFFKYNDHSNIHLFYDPDSFINQGVFSDDSISFIGTPDMHIAMGDYKACDYAFRRGDDMVDKLFDKFITDTFIRQFDYTIIYSDHGCQFENEFVRMRSSLDLLDNRRNQLLMFIHKKGDGIINSDSRIASMVDLYSTIEQLIGGSDFRQGFSLLDNPRRRMAHIEDHKDFLVYPEIMIKQWRVISDEFDIRTDVKNTIIMKGSEDDKNDAIAYLKEFSPRYNDYVKQLMVWDHYERFVCKMGRQYFVGENRESRRILFFFKAYFKLKRLLKILL